MLKERLLGSLKVTIAILGTTILIMTLIGVGIYLSECYSGIVAGIYWIGFAFVFIFSLVFVTSG